MYLISAEGYKNAGVRFVRVRKIGEIWPSMKNVQHGVGVQNMQKTTKKFMSKMMLWILLLNAAEMKKKRDERKIDGFTKKLMIPDSEISECPEHEVLSKIGNIFVNEKTLEEYSVRVCKTDFYFYEHYRKKYKLMKMGVNIYYLELMSILLNIS